MTTDYNDLKALELSTGYLKLQALWGHEGQKILDAVKRAGKKGNETSWRYYAGQMEGFELAITHLHRALADMEKTGETEPPQEREPADIIAELRGDK
jgi:hypothetical protein